VILFRKPGEGTTMVLFTTCYKVRILPYILRSCSRPLPVQTSYLLACYPQCLAGFYLTNFRTLAQSTTS